MWRFAKLPSLVVLTVCVLVIGACPAQAQTGSYSLTVYANVNSGSAPEGGGVPNNTIVNGNWGTILGDTVDSITVYYSTDNTNWTPVSVPANNITGGGTVSGTYYVTFNLSKGELLYQIEDVYNKWQKCNIVDYLFYTSLIRIWACPRAHLSRP